MAFLETLGRTTAAGKFTLDNQTGLHFYILLINTLGSINYQFKTDYAAPPPLISDNNV